VNKKETLRKEALARREALGEAERRRKSELIRGRLFTMSPFQRAAVVHFYLSTNSEMATEEAIRGALSAGKRVVIPRVDRARREMTLSELKDYDRELAPGSHGIREPKPGCYRFVPLKEVDLLVVPVVAFDVSGHRLGYGTGYYDRLLSDEKVRPLLIGVAFDVQEVPDIPADDHDIRMDWIVTEERILDIRQEKGKG
jgi:5-formyltetrahydrofolate cyclo-ligase